MQRKFLLELIHEKVDLEFYKNHQHEDNGVDLFILDDLTIVPGETVLVDLGIKCRCVTKTKCIWKRLIGKKYNYHSYFLFPTSNFTKTPLIMKNSIGLIDKGYTDSIKMPLTNISNQEFTIKRGERYVQLVNANLSHVKFKLINSLQTRK